MNTNQLRFLLLKQNLKLHESKRHCGNDKKRNCFATWDAKLLPTCETYWKGKLYSFLKVLEKIISHLKWYMLTFALLWGRKPIGKAKYFVTFIYDFSRWTEVKFLRKKIKYLRNSEGLGHLWKIKRVLRAKCLQSDNSGEFCNDELHSSREWCSRKEETTLVEVARHFLGWSKLYIPGIHEYTGCLRNAPTKKNWKLVWMSRYH